MTMQFVMVAGIGVVVDPGVQLARVHHHRALLLAQRDRLWIDDLDSHAVSPSSSPHQGDRQCRHVGTAFAG